MAAGSDSDETLSIVGPLRSILIPRHLGFEDPRELGKAMVAWNFLLSHAEVCLLQHIAEGLTNDEIAGNLGLAEEKTAKNRIQHLYSKLGVKSRVQATVIAVEHGLLTAKVVVPKQNG